MAKLILKDDCEIGRMVYNDPKDAGYGAFTIGDTVMWLNNITKKIQKTRDFLCDSNETGSLNDKDYYDMTDALELANDFIKMIDNIEFDKEN